MDTEYSSSDQKGTSLWLTNLFSQMCPISEGGTIYISFQMTNLVREGKYDRAKKEQEEQTPLCSAHTVCQSPG